MAKRKVGTAKDHREWWNSMTRHEQQTLFEWVEESDEVKYSLRSTIGTIFDDWASKRPLTAKQIGILRDWFRPCRIK